MSINGTKSRVGNITSSGIFDLMSLAKNGKDFGAPALSYIYDCNLERRLQLPINTETEAIQTDWGNAIESNVHELLPLSYEYTSQVTNTHPEYDYWRGSADGFNNDGERAVIDIKSPFTRASFCGLVMPLACGLTGTEAMNAIRWGFTDTEGREWKKHKDAEKYYWQLVSNACINNTEWAELIIYMPYQSELLGLTDIMMNHPRLKWAGDRVPFINDGGFFRNLNIIRFKVPKEDKELLTENVKKAGEMLIKVPSVIIASQPEPSITLIGKA